MSRTCVGQWFGGGGFKTPNPEVGFQQTGVGRTGVGMMDFVLFFCVFFSGECLKWLKIVGTKWFVSMLKPFCYFDFLVIKWRFVYLAFFQFERGV